MFQIFVDKFTPDLEQRCIKDNFRDTIRFEGFSSDIPTGRFRVDQKGDVYLMNVTAEEMQPVIDAGFAIEVEYRPL